MFERYTEKARQTIFFARFEACQFGQPYIETEHLLLGLLREDKAIAHLFLKNLRAYDDVRQQIEQLTPAYGREKVSTSVDLPLSNESKRILAYAADEADRFGHKHLGTEHLLLGMLRESDCLAAKLLNERGVGLVTARAMMPNIALSRTAVPKPVTAPAAIDSIEIHGARWNAAYVLPLVNDMRNFHWQKAEWKPRDILVHKEDGNLWFYSGQPYDSSIFELKPGGWPRDRCRICRWELCESDNPTHGTGYTNGRDWLCAECHYKFIEGYKPEPEDYT